MKNNYNKKIQKKILAKIDEDRQKMLENLSIVKNRISKKDLEMIDDWNGYKDSYSNIIKIDKFNKKKLKKYKFSYVNTKLNYVLKKTNEVVKFSKTKLFFFENKINYKSIYHIYYNMLNLKNRDKNKNIFNFKKTLNNKKILYININYKTLRTKLSIFKFNKCLLTLSNGIFLKKMGIDKKKYVKSDKLTAINIRTINNILKNNFNGYKIIVNNIGIRKKINNFINIIFKKFKKENNFCIINQPKINFNSYFKFKKVKSIKRKLKKKMLKMK